MNGGVRLLLFCVVDLVESGGASLVEQLLMVVFSLVVAVKSDNVRLMFSGSFQICVCSRTKVSCLTILCY
jgi:hypothetical protein